MFKWLKERRRARKEKERRKIEDCYGFRVKENVATSNYGFNEEGRYILDNRVVDSPYHVYEEIEDLPELSLSSEFTQLNLQVVENDKVRAPASRRLFKTTECEGPYMIVPIVDDEAEACEGRHNCTCASSDKRSSFHSGGTTESSLCWCMQRSDAEGFFKCTCQKVQRPSDDYLDPWDSSVNSGNSVLSSLSDNTLFPIGRNLQNHNTNSVIKADDVGSSIESINRSEEETDDTGCEHDLNSSGESDDSDYKSYLNKVEQNLILKEQVKNIVKTVTMRNTHTRNNQYLSNRVNRVSTLPVSSQLYTARMRSCGDVTDFFVNCSESDDSSGYYDCSNETLEREKYYSNHRSSPRSEKIQSCVKENISDFHELVLLSTRRGRSKPKSFRLKHRKPFPMKIDKVKKIEEDTELYLLPTNKRFPEYSDVRAYREPVGLFRNTQTQPIYHDPYRTKPSGSGNRLLQDLIYMNNNKLHMML